MPAKPSRRHNPLTIIGGCFCVKKWAFGHILLSRWSVLLVMAVLCCACGLDDSVKRMCLNFTELAPNHFLYQMTVAAFAGLSILLSQFFSFPLQSTHITLWVDTCGGWRENNLLLLLSLVLKVIKCATRVPLSAELGTDCKTRCEVESRVTRSFMSLSLSSMVLMRVESAVLRCRRSAGCKWTFSEETYIRRCVVVSRGMH